jgi:hypothetical protein
MDRTRFGLGEETLHFAWYLSPPLPLAGEEMVRVQMSEYMMDVSAAQISFRQRGCGAIHLVYFLNGCFSGGWGVFSHIHLLEIRHQIS